MRIALVGLVMTGPMVVGPTAVGSAGPEPGRGGSVSAGMAQVGVPAAPGVPASPGAEGASGVEGASGDTAPPLPVPEHTPEQARRTADDVLNRPEYRQPPKPWFEQAQEAVLDALGRVLGSLFEGGAGTAAAWILVAAIVAGLVFFGLRLGRTVRTDPGTKVEVAVTPKMTAAEWRARAEGFEADQDWKQALRCRYRALVGDLVDQGVVRDVPGRTVGEYRLDVAATAPGAEDDFDRASALFEAAWYGDEATGSEENRRFRALADGVAARVKVS